ncbi:MAG: FAD-dependent oxidoreductase [Eubacteriales bacterium]|nr:FAD-dependent oxidoreductase [Eubacteriales bacterium]
MIRKLTAGRDDILNTYDYVILGNGVAGHNAAAAIRTQDKEGTLLMISDEAYRSYNRPMLTKTLTEALTIEAIAIKPEGWYEEMQIDQLLSCTVEAVRPAEKQVVLTGGNTVGYGKLIYAQGAECFIPPIEGADKDGVIAVRRFADTEKVLAALQTAKHAVVIGGGVLGLEAAWELKKAGCEVEVLELAPVLMEKQLDAEGGALLQEIGETEGVHIRTGVTIEAITGAGHAEGVKLADGTVIPAELVLISCGVRANTALAKEAGLTVERAVVVNEKMQTSDPCIYACGDCAQYNGVNNAILAQAMEQGKIAGNQAAGGELTYQPKDAAIIFRGMNTALFAAGDTGKNTELTYQTKETRDAEKKSYQKYYFTDGKLCGAILIGDTSSMGKLMTALKNHVGYDEIG